MNTTIYQDKLHKKGASVFRGKIDEMVSPSEIEGPSIINEFLADDDI